MNAKLEATNRVTDSRPQRQSPLDRDPDRATPIGSLPEQHLSSARRTRLVDDEVRFSKEPEEAIRVYPAVLRGLTLRRGPGLRFFRYEVKAERGVGPAPRDVLIVTEQPYSNEWSIEARFKVGSRRSAEERESVEATSLSEALEEISRRESDPWETGTLLTAGFVLPEQPALSDDPMRQPAAAHHLFGICQDPKAFREKILASDAAQKLLRITFGGQLRVGPNKNIPVHPRVIEDANTAMVGAVMQALAGPKDSDDLVGEPVMQLVYRIYCDRLYNWTRRALVEDERTDRPPRTFFRRVPGARSSRRFGAPELSCSGASRSRV